MSIDRNFVLNLAHESSDTNEYILSLYNIPKQMKAKTIVEIGAGRSTFALVAAAFETDGHVTSIDIGGEGTLDRVQWGKETMKKESDGRFTMLMQSSLDVEWDKPIDFLFLDSEHTFDLTKAEMEKWFPKVRKGGVIMMHDTAAEGGQQVQCRQAFEEWYKKHKKEYTVVHLLDTKIIGMSILVKI